MCITWSFLDKYFYSLYTKIYKLFHRQDSDECIGYYFCVLLIPGLTLLDSDVWMNDRIHVLRITRSHTFDNPYHRNTMGCIFILYAALWRNDISNPDLIVKKSQEYPYVPYINNNNNDNNDNNTYIYIYLLTYCAWYLTNAFDVTQDWKLISTLLLIRSL